MDVRKCIAPCFVCVCARVHILLCTPLPKTCRRISNRLSVTARFCFKVVSYNYVGTYFYLKLKFQLPSSSYLSMPYLSVLKKFYLNILFPLFYWQYVHTWSQMKKTGLWSDWCAKRGSTHTHKGRVCTLKRTLFLTTWLPGDLAMGFVKEG